MSTAAQDAFVQCSSSAWSDDFFRVPSSFDPGVVNLLSHTTTLAAVDVMCVLDDAITQQQNQHAAAGDIARVWQDPGSNMQIDAAEDADWFAATTKSTDKKTNCIEAPPTAIFEPDAPQSTRSFPLEPSSTAHYLYRADYMHSALHPHDNVDAASTLDVSLVKREYEAVVNYKPRRPSGPQTTLRLPLSCQRTASHASDSSSCTSEHSLGGGLGGRGGCKASRPRGLDKPRVAWTAEEEAIFVKALKKFGPDIDPASMIHPCTGRLTVRLGPNVAEIISMVVGTRSVTQVRSHVQKYYNRMSKANMAQSHVPDTKLKL